MKAAGLLLAIFLVHTSSLWSKTNLAGNFGDTLAHAAMPEWYCSNVATWDFHTNRYYAPDGIDLSTNFDSPFPLILTCPLAPLGGHVQFHVFVAIQILLILISSLLVARTLFPNWLWQCAYVLTVWFTGFYFSQSLEHYTLFSGIWGFQLLIWSGVTFDLDNRWNMVLRGILIGLAFSGTFHNVAMMALPSLVIIAIAVHKKWPLRLTQTLNLVFAGCGCVGIFGYLFFPAIHAYLTSDLITTPGVRGLYSADLMAFFMPSITSGFYSFVYSHLPVPFELVTHFERTNSLDLLVWIPLILSVRRREIWRDKFNLGLAGLAIFYLFLSFGPTIKLQDHELVTNPLGTVLEIFPFSLSRTPGRLLLVSVLSLTYLAYLSVKDLWGQRKWFNTLAIALIAWELIVGPALNQSVTLPTRKISDLLPEHGLSVIKDDRSGEIVAHLPMAQIQEAAQNYMQLLHGKNINAGYLAYTAYPRLDKTKINMAYFSPNACAGRDLTFRQPPWHEVRSDLQRMKIHHLIVNKALLNEANCEALREWVNRLGSEPWIKKIDENDTYVVLQAD